MIEFSLSPYQRHLKRKFELKIVLTFVIILLSLMLLAIAGNMNSDIQIEKQQKFVDLKTISYANNNF